MGTHTLPLALLSFPFLLPQPTSPTSSRDKALLFSLSCQSVLGRPVSLYELLFHEPLAARLLAMARAAFALSLDQPIDGALSRLP